MRESIGTSFMLNFIILFIFLVFSFLAATLSYYKSYRINNLIVNAIEKYEGYNELSKLEIKGALSNIGYDVSVSSNCQKTKDTISTNYMAGQDGEITEYKSVGKHVDDNVNEGYCIYLYWNDNGVLAYDRSGVATTDNYYNYGVLTYMQLRFPVVEYVLKIPIFSRTNTMYFFE